MTLAWVALPADEVARMKSAHVKLLSILISYANRDGEAWPSLRTLAARCEQSLDWVGKHLKQMASLGYFRRSPKGAGYLYRIAKRFLFMRRQESAPADSRKPRPAAGQTAKHAPACQQPGVRERVQKENQTQGFTKSVGSFRRFAARTKETTGQIRDRWIAKLGRYAAARGFVAEFWTRGMGDDPAAVAAYYDRIDRRMRGEGWDDGGGQEAAA